MTTWIVLISVGLGTLALRTAMLIRSTPLPPAVERRLPLVGPSALAAIAAPALLDIEHTTDASGVLSVALAIVATVSVWSYRRTFAPPLLAGMGVWWLSEAVLGVV